MLLYSRAINTTGATECVMGWGKKVRSR